jgi:phage terminase large subunit GpA-like protein
VPDEVAVLTRSVDVQGDRLETAVWGWGAGEEAWLIEHELIPGDPGTPAPWKELERSFRRARTRHARRRQAPPPVVTFIDSGGHNTKEVYAT